MAHTRERQIGILLTDTDAEIFEVPAGETWTISEIVVANIDTADHFVEIHHTPDGSSTDGNTVLPNCPVKAGQVLGYGRGHVYQAGDSMRGKADEDDVVAVTVYYDKEVAD